VIIAGVSLGEEVKSKQGKRAYGDERAHGLIKPDDPPGHRTPPTDEPDHLAWAPSDEQADDGSEREEHDVGP